MLCLGSGGVLFGGPVVKRLHNGSCVQFWFPVSGLWSALVMLEGQVLNTGAHGLVNISAGGACRSHGRLSRSALSVVVVGGKSNVAAPATEARRLKSMGIEDEC